MSRLAPKTFAIFLLICALSLVLCDQICEEGLPGKSEQCLIFQNDKVRGVQLQTEMEAYASILQGGDFINHNEHVEMCSIDPEEGCGQKINEEERQYLIDSNQRNVDKSAENVEIYLITLEKNLRNWIGFKEESQLLEAMADCDVQTKSNILINLYEVLEIFSADLKEGHIQILQSYLQKYSDIGLVLSCLIDSRTDSEAVSNKFFQQKHKMQTIKRFITTGVKESKGLFGRQGNVAHKAQKLAAFLRAFFQSYYLTVSNPAETLSTQFLRYLTILANAFHHQDIAFCIDIDAVAALSVSLENLNIHTIYIKICEVFDTLRILKPKQKCSQQIIESIKTMQQNIQGIKMFEAMMQENEDYIDIGNQKDVSLQLKKLAMKIAVILDNSEKYRQTNFQEL